MPGTITLQVLRVPVAVPVAVRTWFAHFPTVDSDPVGRVLSGEPNTALAELTQIAVEHTPLLCIHAGVVTSARGILALPGYSGLGKTTAVAALVRAGFGYVSDEALAIDRQTGAVEAFPRPLALDAAAWHLIGGLGVPPAPGAEALAQPDQLGALATALRPVAAVVLAERRPGRTALEPVRRADAVVPLLRRSFNHFRDPEASFRAIVGLLQIATVWRAAYSDARELAERLHGEFGG